MADNPTRDQTTPVSAGIDDPLPTADDPGGAHSKGFSADPRPDAAIPETGPVPLTEAPEGATVHVPERDNQVQPTGRNEPGEYGPNDRLMGSDR